MERVSPMFSFLLLCCCPLLSLALVDSSLSNATRNSRDYTFQPLPDNYVAPLPDTYLTPDASEDDHISTISQSSHQHPVHNHPSHSHPQHKRQPKPRFLNIFPNGGVLKNNFQLSLPIPICTFTTPDTVVYPCKNLCY